MQVVGYERAIGLTGLYLYVLIFIGLVGKSVPPPKKKVDFKNGRNKTLKC